MMWRLLFSLPILDWLEDVKIYVFSILNVDFFQVCWFKQILKNKKFEASNPRLNGWSDTFPKSFNIILITRGQKCDIVYEYQGCVKVRKSGGWDE